MVRTVTQSPNGGGGGGGGGENSELAGGQGDITSKRERIDTTVALAMQAPDKTS